MRSPLAAEDVWDEAGAERLKLGREGADRLPFQRSTSVKPRKINMPASVTIKAGILM
jgi:hypothetical protein